MIWILVACTEAWVLCGSVLEVEYQSKEDCYEARSLLIDDKGADYFKYVICKPEQEVK